MEKIIENDKTNDEIKEFIDNAIELKNLSYLEFVKINYLMKGIKLSKTGKCSGI